MFLGSGTSFGIPVIGCDCGTCVSTDPRDSRTRHGALIEHDDGRVLIDTPPELRMQMLRSGVTDIDAVWYTHSHADHVHGLDDLRIFSMRHRAPIDVFGSEICTRTLASRFDYIFDPEAKPAEGTTRPEATLHAFRAYKPVDVAGIDMLPLPVPHGPVEVFGFRAGDLGYITDAKRLPERTRAALEGVRVLVLNALWFGNPHPTHFNVEEAVGVAEDIGAEATYLTHLTHRLRHADLESRLPAGILPAYDGLEVEI